MAAIGARTSRRSRCPSGRRKAWTVTSFGISCARGRLGRASTTTAVVTMKSAARPRASGRRSIAIRRSVYWRPIRGESSTVRISITLAMRMNRSALTAAVARCRDRLHRVSGHAWQTSSPRLQVDPLWPKPLPNHWLFGSITGVAVDSQDHVWVVHRGADSLNARTEMSAATNPPTADECCHPAPPVLEFDQSGALVGHWGGPGAGYEWPRSPGGIAVDAQGNVWIAAAGITETAGARGRGAEPAAAASARGRTRPEVLARRGSSCCRSGRRGSLAATTARPDCTAPWPSMWTPPRTKSMSPTVSATAASSSLTRRPEPTSVTGARTAPLRPRPSRVRTIPARRPRSSFEPSAASRSRATGHVYVCDRLNNRIQVFRKNGTFVKEAFVSKTTTGEGSVWDLAFSRDPQQRFLFVADGQDQKVFVLDRDKLASRVELWRRGTVAGRILRRRQRRCRLEGQRLHGRELRGQAPAEVRQ